MLPIYDKNCLIEKQYHVIINFLRNSYCSTTSALQAEEFETKLKLTKLRKVFHIIFSLPTGRKASETLKTRKAITPQPAFGVAKILLSGYLFLLGHSFKEIRQKFKPACKDSRAGGSATKNLSLEYNRMVQITFEPRPSR